MSAARDYYLSTPHFTCWVQVVDGLITDSAPYLFREHGRSWSALLVRLKRAYGSKVRYGPVPLCATPEART